MSQYEDGFEAGFQACNDVARERIEELEREVERKDALADAWCTEATHHRNENERLHEALRGLIAASYSDEGVTDADWGVAALVVASQPSGETAE